MIDNRHSASHESHLFFIASIIIAQGLWTIFFHLGSYNSVAYDHLFIVLCASIAALIANVIINKTGENEHYLSGFGTVVLTFPIAWFLCEVIFHNVNINSVHVLRFILTASVILVSIPYILYLLLTAALPDVSEIKQNKFIYGLAFIGLFISSLAYLSGKNNYYIMTCDDFNSIKLPKNCYQTSLHYISPDGHPEAIP